MDPHTMVVGDFSISLSKIYKSSRQTLNKKTGAKQCLKSNGPKKLLQNTVPKHS